jgi:hypothetical protein
MTADELDITLVTRGAWRGFCVLLLGGMVQPLVIMASHPLGFWWLALVAAAAFGYASFSAVRPHLATQHRLQGAIAAIASYLLVLPLVVMGSHTFDVVQVFCTTTLAVVIGAVVGLLRMRGTPLRGR